MAALAIGVDREGDEPVYAQIARQIRARIASGDVKPGTALPSVRALASDLGINLNTVARAYRMLETEGFVAIRDRAGVEVTAPATRANPGTRESLRESLREVVARMRQAGMTVDEIERLSRQEIASLDADTRRPR